jgi:hypothetical protein
LGNQSTKQELKLNIDGKYDPLSITNRVKDRIEKKANGVAVPDAKPISSQHISAQHDHHTSARQLKEDFLDFLLDDPKTAQNASAEDNRSSSEKNLQIKGTKELFSPLNKGEVKEKSSEKSPFSFAINNSALGELTINGDYSSGGLVLSIDLPKPMDVKDQYVLAKILKTKLSKELGVPLEVKIGRSIK